MTRAEFQAACYERARQEESPMRQEQFKYLATLADSIADENLDSFIRSRRDVTGEYPEDEEVDF